MYLCEVCKNLYENPIQCDECEDGDMYIEDTD